jgi:hypothetical protein
LDWLTDLTWLQDVGSSKAPLAFIVFSFLGLYSSIAFVVIEEKRFPTRYDFTKLFAYLPFVWGIALLIGINPFLSFLLGLIPEPTYKLARRYAEKRLKKLFESEDGQAKIRDDGGEILAIKDKKP